MFNENDLFNVFILNCPSSIFLNITKNFTDKISIMYYFSLIGNLHYKILNDDFDNITVSYINHIFNNKFKNLRKYNIHENNYVLWIDFLKLFLFDIHNNINLNNKILYIELYKNINDEINIFSKED